MQATWDFLIISHAPPPAANLLLHPLSLPAALTHPSTALGPSPPYPPCLQDAMRFPLVGSLVLFSLFLAFKFLPKEIVNAILSGALLRWLC